LQTFDSRSISKKGDDCRVRACNHEDSSVSPSDVLTSSQEDITDGDEKDSSDDMEGSFSGSIRMPGVANNDEEGENLTGDCTISFWSSRSLIVD
jgi:hypothetical protein